MYPACQKNGNALASPYCTSSSIVADICKASDLSTLPSSVTTFCATYNVPETCVIDAGNCTALPNLPAATSTFADVKDICGMMSTTGCSDCSGAAIANVGMSGMKQCDLLSVYMNLCMMMPTSTLSICGGKGASLISSAPTSTPTSSSLDDTITSSNVPMMQMYFHTGITDYILSSSWVPQTNAQYAGAWIFCYVLAVSYEAWLTFTAWALTRTAGKAVVRPARRAEKQGVDASADPGSNAILGDGAATGSVSRGTLVGVAVVRGLMRTVSAIIAYLLMLIVMSYNIGLFFAVVLGLGTGSAIFGGKLLILAKGAASARGGNVEGDWELCC
ncbi:hypothetical protein HK101_011244 [Irineochytrium annulatum]|nr:hypothetical protein HK101_011244 [Irineochytrium annulatum]